MEIIFGISFNQSDTFYIIALIDSFWKKNLLLLLIILTPLELVDVTEEVWHEAGTSWVGILYYIGYLMQYL